LQVGKKEQFGWLGGTWNGKKSNRWKNNDHMTIITWEKSTGKVKDMISGKSNILKIRKGGGIVEGEMHFKRRKYGLNEGWRRSFDLRRTNKKNSRQTTNKKPSTKTIKRSIKRRMHGKVQEKL